MKDKKGMARSYMPTSPTYASGPVERYRPRTAIETIEDAYSSVLQATALNTVTHMAIDSVRTVVEHRDKLLADYPHMEPELNALGANHVRNLMLIQNQVTDNTRREKG